MNRTYRDTDSIACVKILKILYLDNTKKFVKTAYVRNLIFLMSSDRKAINVWYKTFGGPFDPHCRRFFSYVLCKTVLNFCQISLSCNRITYTGCASFALFIYTWAIFLIIILSQYVHDLLFEVCQAFHSHDVKAYHGVRSLQAS